MNLRKAARGRDCMVCLPVCNHQPETVVLAHIRNFWGAMSMKPPDICAVYACSSCHDEIDRRSQTLDADFVELEMYRAWNRQILMYCNLGVLKW